VNPVHTAGVKSGGFKGEHVGGGGGGVGGVGRRRAALKGGSSLSDLSLRPRARPGWSFHEEDDPGPID
jgi:hypothetical protein